MTLARERVQQLIDRAHREIDSGLLPSCQIALARHGEIQHFETLGEATDDTRYVMFSCTKAIVAGAAWIAIGEGLIDTTAKVVDYIPEFAPLGKDVITVEQVMLHTAGFPHAPMGADVWNDRDLRVKRFGEWRLNWEPGTRYEYHPTSAHWVLAEILDRVTGIDYRRFVHERIAVPHGLTRLRLGAPDGVPADPLTDVAPMELRGEPATAEENMAIYGIPELPVTEVTDDALMSFNNAPVRAVGVPGGGAVATAADLALYYQALLHNPAGVWEDIVLRDATGTVRNSLPDPLLRVPANRALGVVVAGSDGKANLRGMGHTVGPRTFGHNGAAGQIAWADPDTGLSFVYFTNGIDAHGIRQGRRGVALSSIAATCAA
jgi:CubicO group peptidase (beta-lactamase class C family)